MFESLIAAKSFGLKPEMHVLSKLGKVMPLLLGIYLAFKLGDMFIRETFVYLFEFNTVSVMFLIELFVGVIIPIRLFLSQKVLNKPCLLMVASGMVVFGVFLNRVNNFVTAYTPPFADYSYFPSYGEISVTLGFVAILVLLYRAFVMIFPVISIPKDPERNQVEEC
jgi:Ni/Fe-hydrogenase subunit HybB-like protein